MASSSSRSRTATVLVIRPLATALDGARWLPRRVLSVPARDRGSSVVEFVVIIPGVLLAILLIIQIGLWQHARHIALPAAQEGARAARAYNATADTGRRRAANYLPPLAPRLFMPPTFTPNPTPPPAPSVFL